MVDRAVATCTQIDLTSQWLEHNNNNIMALHAPIDHEATECDWLLGTLK